MKYLRLLLILSSALPLVAQETTPKTPAADVPAMDPAASRELIHQWVFTERLVSEEKTNWQVEKQRMQDLLDLYQKELTLLNEEVAQAGTSVEEGDAKKQYLQNELKQYREANQLLTEALTRLLPRVQRWLPRLPQPLQREQAADIEVLQSPKAMDKPRDVLKSLLAVLAASGRFNRSVTVVEETRPMEEGKTMTVDVLYLGLARAYYASKSGDTAGVGVPDQKAWSWQQKPELAKEIRRAIAIHAKEGQPQLIQLPVSLSNSKDNQ